MAKDVYRSAKTGVSSDEWYQSLTPHARLLFWTIWDSRDMTACGAAKTTIPTLCFETGLSRPELLEAMDVLCAPFKSETMGCDIARFMWWPQYNLIWSRNFYRLQRNNTNPHNFDTSARSSLSGLPDDVKDAITMVYPTLTNKVGNPSPWDTNGIAIPSTWDVDASRTHGDTSNILTRNKETFNNHQDREKPTKTVPKQAPLPPQVQADIELRDFLMQEAATLMNRGKLTKAHENKLHGWFSEHKRALTREIISEAVDAAATYTEGDSLGYMLTVMQRCIDSPGRGKPVRSSGNGKPVQRTDAVMDSVTGEWVPAERHSWATNGDGLFVLNKRDLTGVYPSGLSTAQEHEAWERRKWQEHDARKREKATGRRATGERIGAA